MAICCDKLKFLLKKSVKDNYSDVLLLSGGLDSSILACLLKPELSLTVSLGKNAPDIEYAKRVSKKFGKTHQIIVLSFEELLEIVEDVIRILKTFDPMEVRNSSVGLAAIKYAKKSGHRRVMTGDGGDELFAGYNYLKRYHNDLGRLDQELRRLWQSMHFSSLKIGRDLDIAVNTPFLEKHFVLCAKSIKPVEKIGYYQGQAWGKYILRKCYQSELGEEIVWRPKLAQELGAGTAIMKDLISSYMEDDQFMEGRGQATSDGVTIRDKEHLYYYLLFRKYFSAPKNELCPDVRCPQCRACCNPLDRFCHTCGAFPIKPC